MACKVLIVGCGDLGTAVAGILNRENDFEIYGLRRSHALLPDNIQPVHADVTEPASLKGLIELNPEILVYCVAASVQTDESYRAHYVDGLRNVLSSLTEAKHLRHIFFVSSTRVYGQETIQMLNEITPAIPSDFGGRRLLEAESLLKSISVPSTVLRLSGIYGPGRVRMIQLSRTPKIWPKENGWTNRIHRDDAAGFIVYLIRKVLENMRVQDCFVVTDNLPIPQYEVLLWLAEQMGVDVSDKTVPPTQGGKRLSNQRMRDTGFSLTYQDYRPGYGRLLLEQAGP